VEALPLSRRPLALRLAAAAQRVEVRVAALWFALAGVLAVLTTRVVDWYVMTDELLYERLAISSVYSHSPLPHIHGELVGNVNQLYPLLLAPFFHDALVPTALTYAHVLNAIVMSSAAIPAFLLARRVATRPWLAYLVAAVSVCIPWIVLSSFLMTEVVAYPAFLWAMLAIHQATVRPSVRSDLLLVGALVVATLARTQFAALLVVVPLALFLHQLTLSKGVRSAVRDVVAAHRVLAPGYAVLVVLGLVLLVAGRLSSALGTYSVTAEGDLIPHGFGRSLLEHLAPIGLGMGIVPFVLGVAWLLTSLVRARTRERHAFAVVTATTIVVLLFEVTSYDLRFGQGRLHDRYLFYVVPLLLIAFALFVEEAQPRLLAVTSAGALLALAFLFLPVRRYDKLNVDSPVAALNGALLDLGGSKRGGQLLLCFVTIVVTCAFLLPRRRRAVAALLAVATLAIPAQTALAFTRLFTVDGTSGRPITTDQSVVFDWIDRKLGPGEKVTMVPYPFQYGNYWENVAYWWNVEFWNASVKRAALYEGAFTGTPETFPTIPLSFDRTSGRANVTSSPYAVQAVAETRFHLAGTSLGEDRGIVLSRTEQPWRADWLAFDLYRDGWTIPKVVGKIRVFAAPNQTAPTMRFVTISVRGPDGQPARDFEVTSNAASWRARAAETPVSNQVEVCVPPNGFADVRIRAPHYSPIYGDPRSESSFVSYARSGGVLITGIALADETRPC
jgi:hypothetical protein